MFIIRARFSTSGSRLEKPGSNEICLLSLARDGRALEDNMYLRPLAHT